VSGAKNAVLPALAASLLTQDAVVLRNVPRVRDVRTMQRLLRHLGAEVTEPDASSCQVRMRSPGEPEAPYDLVKTMRASILTLGPMVARFGVSRVSLPGGCAIGERPIDMHLEALRRMGAEVELAHGYVSARAKRLRGAEIGFAQPTVTGTENVLMAASLADGVTVLSNCAREPEIVDLAGLLRSMGARIEGDGTEIIRVEGVRELGGAEHTIIPDRIEAATFCIAGVIAGGDLTVDRCDPSHLDAPIRRLRELGASIETGPSSLRIKGGSPLAAGDMATAPYPGFPTDLQAQYMVAMTQARGRSIITESIFENRFMHVGELRRMGAAIGHDGRRAVVEGPVRLSGAQVMATDLRASASLVLAALVAEGETTVDRVYHIDRGYEWIEEKLRRVGADIERLA